MGRASTEFLATVDGKEEWWRKKDEEEERELIMFGVCLVLSLDTWQLLICWRQIIF